MNDSPLPQLEDVTLPGTGGAVVLLGESNGKYPDANGVLVPGPEETLLLDAPLGVHRRLEATPGRISGCQIDRAILTHCHEDHLPGLALLPPELEVGVHHLEAQGLHDIEAFLDLFGMTGDNRERFRKLTLDRFHYQARSVVREYDDGERWQLGGDVSVTAIHTPGHTPGHCSLLLEPAGLLFLGDIDLSSFGPLYSDADASLVDFETSIARVREIDCAYYLSGHHVGLIEGRAAFLERLERYSARIGAREGALLEFLSEPRTLDEIVAHRFVYRPQDQLNGIDDIERKSMSLHLERLIPLGAVAELTDDSQIRYRAV
jgi:glyoxylase-like metal-dependent hydrolase (beta-lactamase superfamily II)